MREIPILFSTPMVQVILDGRKTQTRRVIKDKDITNWFDIDVDGKPIAYIDQETGDSYPPTHRAKYQPGDILWVRETWCKVTLDGHYAPNCYQGEFYYYKADGREIESCGAFEGWRPSIFMPREACRIKLRVINVKVERLQDITEDDAMAEGLYPGYQYTKTSSHAGTARQAFMWIWQKINGNESWLLNPWVWVIEFAKL